MIKFLKYLYFIWRNWQLTKKYEDSINSMVKKIIDNKSSIRRGFSIAASIMLEDCYLINSKVNSRLNDKTTDYKNHAETKCYDKALGGAVITLSGSKKFILIITIPPCSECLKEISSDENVNLEIYYICDNVRNKLNKFYLKEWKSSCKGEINNIFSVIENKLQRMQLYYMALVYMNACLTQKLVNITQQELIVKTVKILKEIWSEVQIESNLTKEKIPDEILLMVERIKEFDFLDISYMKIKDLLDKL